MPRRNKNYTEWHDEPDCTECMRRLEPDEGGLECLCGLVHCTKCRDAFDVHKAGCQAYKSFMATNTSHGDEDEADAERYDGSKQSDEESSDDEDEEEEQTLEDFAKFALGSGARSQADQARSGKSTKKRSKAPTPAHPHVQRRREAEREQLEKERAEREEKLKTKRKDETVMALEAVQSSMRIHHYDQTRAVEEPKRETEDIQPSAVSNPGPIPEKKEKEEEPDESEEAKFAKLSPEARKAKIDALVKEATSIIRDLKKAPVVAPAPAPAQPPTKTKGPIDKKGKKRAPPPETNNTTPAPSPAPPRDPHHESRQKQRAAELLRLASRLVSDADVKSGVAIRSLLATTLSEMGLTKEAIVNWCYALEHAQAAGLAPELVTKMRLSLRAAYVEVGDLERATELDFPFGKVTPVVPLSSISEDLKQRMDQALEAGMRAGKMDALHAVVLSCAQEPRTCEILNHRHSQTKITALMIACARHDLELMDRILRAACPIDLEAKDAAGASALVWCARFGELPTMQRLLGMGARFEEDLSPEEIARWPEPVKEALKRMTAS